MKRSSCFNSLFIIPIIFHFGSFFSFSTFILSSFPRSRSWRFQSLEILSSFLWLSYLLVIYCCSFHSVISLHLSCLLCSFVAFNYNGMERSENEAWIKRNKEPTSQPRPVKCHSRLSLMVVSRIVRRIPGDYNQVLRVLFFVFILFLLITFTF